MRLRTVGIAAALLAAACGAVPKAADLVVGGEARSLRTRAEGAPRTSDGHPPLLVLAIDGVNRALLYDLLRKGELPAMAALLGGRNARDASFPHAYLNDTLVATMPSTTMAAWTTAMTGVPPAVHGVMGNEFFIRDENRLGAPAPVSFSSITPTLAIYTDGYLDALKHAPSVYDRMRAREPSILVWVAMHHVFSGADKLIVTKPAILADALENAVAEAGRAITGSKPTFDAYAKVDDEVIEAVVDELAKGDLPDVLTVYLSGTDLYAHIADEGPDEARHAYLTRVVDPALAKLTARLRERHALGDRYVVVTSDHGHTEVRRDAAHAMSTDGDDDPPALMKKAGYRVRPFKLDVDASTPFDSVFVGGGATAYVYVADRSTCAAPDAPCDWKRPPRYEEDVVPMADAFFTNDADGALVPGLKGTLDMVLTRRPRPFAEDDLPFEVYVGHGKTVPIEAYLKDHPHPTYVDFAARMRDLAAGPRGERAGDVMLLAHDGDRASPDERYYFASPYRSWHGSPSRQDSEVPFIVANASRSAESVRAEVAPVLGARPFQQKVTDVLLRLREGGASHTSRKAEGT